MEFIIQRINESLHAYASAQSDWVKAELIEKTARLGQFFLARMAVVLIGTIAVLFISAGAAIWLGGLLESISAGFLVIGGVLLVLATLVGVARKFIFGRRLIRRQAKIFDAKLPAGDYPDTFKELGQIQAHAKWKIGFVVDELEHTRTHISEKISPEHLSHSVGVWAAKQVVNA